MSYATIDDLRSHLGKATTPEASAAYAEKMLHKVPEAPVVDRVAFILGKCDGKRVLEFGASGSLHEKIRACAAAYLGVDRAASDGVVAFDLDDVSHAGLPYPWEAISGENLAVPIKAIEKQSTWTPEVIVCGELLEHLSNPGWFLTRLKKQFSGIETIITVPNAFTESGLKHVRQGIENVNRDHVAWYSFSTMRTLLKRAGYTDFWFGWYNGSPLTAEGLIMVLR